MALDQTRIKKYLKDFNFRELFAEELGWNRPPRVAPIAIDAAEQRFNLVLLAEKSGFQVFACELDPGKTIPDANALLKIERQLTPRAAEHLIVFIDAEHTTQVWQWARHDPNAPIKLHRETYTKGSSGERLAQKLAHLAFSIAEEEKGISVTEVAGRARLAFNLERVARNFYNRFKTEHDAFLKHIGGIDDGEHKSWYASLMLNRLMFVYFIQYKGFLDGDQNYLMNKLRQVRALVGKDSFDSFYRSFLLRLFHEGLGSQDHPADLMKLIGRVPYLNGGLFDVHTLESDNGLNEIEIPDRAFERVFKFFDEYDWHLDDRPLRDDKEINPDVLGYIFEKYINQKQMGAYYTKEDITGYISKNTVLPFLFDRAAKDIAIAFDPQESGCVWRLLQDNPDRYINSVVRRGVIAEDGSEIGLPEHVIEEVQISGSWNRTASPKYALPTERWREYFARRKRCLEIRGKLRRGEIHSINDFITYNLDIQQFAQDIILQTDSPDLVRAFYRAIAGRVPERSNEHYEQGVAVLDPTCGSGAFLFAALNILQPLYEACLDRMEAFVAEADGSGGPQRHAQFRRVLAEIKHHPNRDYFILKSITIGNLYGVDIMEEAVEICKLRLFLKLAAQVERDEAKTNYGLEPLPDIDFNIRTGNTLVGFVDKTSVDNAFAGEVQGKFDFEDKAAEFNEAAQSTERAFERFRQQQTRLGGTVTAKDKAQLGGKLKELSDKLNLFLAHEYGIDTTNRRLFDKWYRSHRPFHWYTDFYGIVKNGGFDVIIGNPPYISAGKVRKEFKIIGYLTNECADIYSSILERAARLLGRNGRAGMIVPLSLTFSRDFAVLRNLLFSSYSTNWFSSFARIPSALFSADVRVRNTIHIGHRSGSDKRTLTTVLHRWFEEARPNLFPNISYATFSPAAFGGLIPKINSSVLAQTFDERLSKKTIAHSFASKETKEILYFKKTAYNWLCFCRILPPCYDSRGRPIGHTKFGAVHFTNKESRDLAFLFLNGKIMFAFWCAIGDDFDVTRWMFANFPLDICSISSADKKHLLPIVTQLEELMIKNTSFKLNAGKKVGNYNLAKCRDITDKSDKIFARLLGFEDSWEDIELMYAQIVKTDFSENETEN